MQRFLYCLIILGFAMLFGADDAFAQRARAERVSATEATGGASSRGAGRSRPPRSEEARESAPADNAAAPAAPAAEEDVLVIEGEAAPASGGIRLGSGRRAAASGEAPAGVLERAASTSARAGASVGGESAPSVEGRVSRSATRAASFDASSGATGGRSARIGSIGSWGFGVDTRPGGEGVSGGGRGADGVPCGANASVSGRRGVCQCNSGFKGDPIAGCTPAASSGSCSPATSASLCDVNAVWTANSGGGGSVRNPSRAGILGRISSISTHSSGSDAVRPGGGQGRGASGACCCQAGYVGNGLINGCVPAGGGTPDCGINAHFDDLLEECQCNDGYGKNGGSVCVKTCPSHATPDSSDVCKCDANYVFNSSGTMCLPCDANATYNSSLGTCACNIGWENADGAVAGTSCINPCTGFDEQPSPEDGHCITICAPGYGVLTIDPID